MFFRLLLLLTLVPLVELVVLLKVHDQLAAHWGARTGFLLTLGMIVLTGVAGAALARQQGLGLIRSIRESLNRGQVPGPALIDGVMVLVGGALLLTPGLLTDALGFSLLLPSVRSIYRRGLSKWFHGMIERGNLQFGAVDLPMSPGPPEDDILDVKVHRDDDPRANDPERERPPPSP